MKAKMSKAPTEVRKNSFFSNFKVSKRVLWTAYRNHR
jgi:hypothetical protein